MNDICGKEKNLKEGYVGCPAVCWNLAHRVVVKELPDVFLYDRPWSVEKIHPPGIHRKVCDKDVVNILFVLEESRLFGFLRIFRNRVSHNYKAIFLFPSPKNRFPEFACLPEVANGMKSAGSGPSFDIGVLFGGNYIAAAGSLQKSDHRAAVVSGVHPKPDAGTGNGFGYFFQTRFDEGYGSGVTGNIAWS